MARRFPKSVRVTIRKAAQVHDKAGHDWEARDTSGTFLTSGWTAGNKADARNEAWHALEEIGLVTDGVES